MSVTLPKINITFSQLANSFITRSERGIAILIVRDDTAGGESFTAYTDATQLEGAAYTNANLQCIKDALSFAPLRVSVAKIGTDGALADALALIVQREKTGWITVAGAAGDDWADLISWIKARESEAKSWKAVVFAAAAPDCMHVVNLTTETVVFADGRREQAGSAYTPSMAGLLAACNVTRGATNALCANLTRVSMPADPDAAVGEGKMILVNDDVDVVRVGVDVNSLVTVNGSTRTEDMKYIETVEAMDLMRDDLRDAFRADYQGQYRNSQNNQNLYLSAANYYLASLEGTVLDPDYDNTAAIDVAAQRAAWVGAGKTEAADWDDATVRATPFKRKLFLAGGVKVLGSMTDLDFAVTLA